MNGALVGLIVVAAIGVILWAMLFVGDKLLENIVSRRTVGQDGEGISLASQAAEDLLVNFVISLGAQGVLLASAEGCERFASPNVKVQRLRRRDRTSRAATLRLRNLAYGYPRRDTVSARYSR